MSYSRFIRFSLTVVLLLCPFTMMAESFKYVYKGVTFLCKTGNSKASIIGFDSNVSRVVIPAEVSNSKGELYQVQNIDIYDSYVTYKTEEIAIERGIRTIDDYCFNNCSNLKVLYVPNTIERFGKKLFRKNRLPEFKMDGQFAALVDLNAMRRGLVVLPFAVKETKQAEPVINYADYGMGSPQTPSKTAPKKEEPVRIAAGTSDVDHDIVAGKTRRDDTFCVIIANEDYENTSKLNYARIDGETFAKYCTITLGIPTDHVHLVTDGTYITMMEQLEWLVNISKVFESDARYIVYYAGHGIVGEDGSCYMLPVNGDPNKVSHGFSLKSLNEKLQEITAHKSSALVLMDACFSGFDRSDVSMLDGEKRGMVKVQEERFTGNVVVMSAVTSTQTSWSYDEKGHGMFTYFLLKKLQTTRGDVTFGELFDYINKEVSRRSVVSKNKPQTPTVNVSDALYSSWKNIKL